MNNILVNGKHIEGYKPSSSLRYHFVDESSVTNPPTDLNDGVSIDLNNNEILLEVSINGEHVNDDKDIQLWVMSIGSNKWYPPEEGLIEKLQERPGGIITFMFADPTIYRKVYIEVLKNDGPSTLQSILVSR